MTEKSISLQAVFFAVKEHTTLVYSSAYAKEKQMDLHVHFLHHLHIFDSCHL